MFVQKRKVKDVKKFIGNNTDLLRPNHEPDHRTFRGCTSTDYSRGHTEGMIFTLFHLGLISFAEWTRLMVEVDHACVCGASCADGQLD